MEQIREFVGEVFVSWREVAQTARLPITNTLTLIHLLRQKSTRQQVDEMLQELGTFIKPAVDIQRHILAGGGAMHADCESLLLQDDSNQTDIGSADWIPRFKKSNLMPLSIFAPTNRTIQWRYKTRASNNGLSQ
jgi:hypothetical protein